MGTHVVDSVVIPVLGLFCGLSMLFLSGWDFVVGVRMAWSGDRSPGRLRGIGLALVGLLCCGCVLIVVQAVQALVRAA